MDKPRRRQAKEADSLEQQIVNSSNTPVETFQDRVEFIPTGSTMLNLAVSQRARNGGWGRGRIFNLVGDGSSGKTLLALEASAQVYYNIQKIKSVLFPPVKKINLVYWNRETVMDFPLEKMYGVSFVSSIEWSEKCNTAEQWGRDVFRRLADHQSGDCFFGVLDSIDSLATEGGQARLAKSIKADKPMDGSYGSGTERAKYFSADFFNNLCAEMKGKDFTLCLISQVRDKIDATMFEKKQVRAGGKALDFYTHQVAWLATAGKLKNEFESKNRIYGVTVRARIERNKVAPPFREAETDILFDYGIDDIGSMVNFLPSVRIQQVFKERFDGRQVSRSMLIEAADNNPEMYDLLIDAVEKFWYEIEEGTKVVRNPRFPNEAA